MKTTEVKKTMIELFDEEKEILYKTAQILKELNIEDENNNIFYDILEEHPDGVVSDFDDIAYVLELLCKQDVIYN